MGASKQMSWVALGVLLVGGGALAVALSRTSEVPARVDRPEADVPTSAPADDVVVAPPEVTGAAVEVTAEVAGPLPLDCGRGVRAAARFGDTELPPITVAELCAALEGSAGPGAGADAELRKRFGPGVLDDIIDDRLVLHALAAATLSVSDADVEAETERLIGERGIPDTAALRSDVRQRLARAALIAASHPAAPSQAEIEAAYAATPGAWGTPASATVEGHLMRVAAGADAPMDEQARAALTAFVGLLRKGRAPPPAAGIEALGRIEVEANGLEPALDAVVFSDAGEGASAKWSDPLRTKVGWLSVHVIETRPAVVRPLSEVEPLVRDAVMLRRDKTAAATLIADLRARAGVSIDIAW